MNTDKDFIPCSARIQFDFYMSKKAEETVEFKTLQDETMTLVNEFRLTLKNKIIKATEIEQDTMLEDLQITLCKATRVITESFIIASGKSYDKDRLVYTLMNSHSDCLLKHTNMNWNKFNTIYKSTFNNSYFFFNLI